MNASSKRPASLTPAWLAPLLARLDTSIARPGATSRTSSAPHPDPAQLARHDEVRLALAAATRLSLPPASDPGPQLVVLGPTQAGKSTLVNRLLDTEIAGVSALAGHTVHAQAFVSEELEAVARDRLPDLLQPLCIVPRDALDIARLDTWSLQAVAAGEHAVAPVQATVWDTPDFDSIAASTYRDAVTLTTALADTLVLVMSKDKYGDHSVWQRLRTVRALGTPLVLVVNKVDASSRDVIERALSARLDERLDGSSDEPVHERANMPRKGPGEGPGDEAQHASGSARRDRPSQDLPTPSVVWLPWVDRPSDQAPLALPDPVRHALGTAVGKALVAAEDLQARRESLQRFIATRRDHWLAPLRIELAARERWEALLADAAGELVNAYQRRWLNGDEHDDAFERTLVELLTLLEVPGIARVLMRTRQAVTWPARQLFGLGMGAASSVARHAGSGFRKNVADTPATPAQRERRLLDELLRERLTALREGVLDEREQADDAGFWRTLDDRFVADRPALVHDWSERASALREELQPQIDAAATRLHRQLQSQPALLNTLRATRVGTDAAGVALAIKSGGVAAADLVLAPAMLSITTLLTESALGRYLDGVKRELKQAQRNAVEQTMVAGLLLPRLRVLAPGGEAHEAAGLALQHEVAASRERVATGGGDPSR